MAPPRAKLDALRQEALAAARGLSKGENALADVLRDLEQERSRAAEAYHAVVRSLPPVALVFLVPVMLMVAAAVVAAVATLLAMWLVFFIVTLGAFGHRRGRYYYRPVRYTRSMPPRSWWA